MQFVKATMLNGKREKIKRAKKEDEKFIPYQQLSFVHFQGETTDDFCLQLAGHVETIKFEFLWWSVNPTLSSCRIEGELGQIGCHDEISTRFLSISL